MKMINSNSMINTFLRECDQLYDDWAHFRNYLNQLHVPEPYFGDPYDCSVVMLNLNPGPASCYWQSQRVLPNGVKTYREHAFPFPYLNPGLQSLNCGGDVWWKNRNKWLKSWLPNGSQGRLPFALELYPWHTANWASVSLQNVNQYINNYNIFKVADLAAQYSRSDIVLAVGKSVGGYLLANGFAKNKVVNSGNCQSVLGLPWPKNKSVPVNRTYEVYCHSSCKSKFIVTWAPGSNNAPSQAFHNIEKAL